jgi:hypothetical protein
MNKIMFKILSIMIVLGSLAACATTKTHTLQYYLLNPNHVEDINKNTQQAKQGDTTNTYLYLENIQLPNYLQQPQLVLFKAPNQLHFSRYHVWAESVEKSINKTLKQQLSSVVWLTKINEKAVSLTIEIDNFYPTQQGEAILTGRYWLKHNNQIRQINFAYHRALEHDGFTDATVQLHLLLVKLANDINTTLFT